MDRSTTIIGFVLWKGLLLLVASRVPMSCLLEKKHGRMRTGIRLMGVLSSFENADRISAL